MTTPSGNDEKLTLSGNELALAQNGCAHAINWWKAQGRSAYCRKERLKFETLNHKLNAISDHAYPYEHSDDMALDVGSEKIMRIDARAVARTRKAAGK